MKEGTGTDEQDDIEQHKSTLSDFAILEQSRARSEARKREVGVNDTRRAMEGVAGLNVGSKGGEMCGTMKANFEASFDAIDGLFRYCDRKAGFGLRLYFKVEEKPGLFTCSKLIERDGTKRNATGCKTDENQNLRFVVVSTERRMSPSVVAGRLEREERYAFRLRGQWNPDAVKMTRTSDTGLTFRPHQMRERIET
uniref:Uncharacterized protein n=1 Tax=Vespula pensylvanica TaxID=30213 RepID=A0A834UAF2_VESPE|nr:hypothetical protein H0235_008088 [Vespula pensylvanica]